MIAEVDEADDEEMLEKEKTKGLEALKEDYIGACVCKGGIWHHERVQTIIANYNYAQVPRPLFWQTDSVPIVNPIDEAALRESRIRSIRARLPREGNVGI